MISSPHISVSAALHIVDDFFIAVDCRIQSIIVQLRINCRFISVTAAMLIDSLSDKVNPLFFVFTDCYKIVICFDCSSPLHKNRRVIAFFPHFVLHDSIAEIANIVHGVVVFLYDCISGCFVIPSI